MIGQAVILSGYAALVLAAVVLVLYQRTSGADATPAAYLATVMSSPVGRWLVLLIWLWIGWHFFVR